jgi:hypothetical protein
VVVRDWGRHPDQNSYPDCLGGLGSRKTAHIAMSASPLVTVARQGRGRGRQAWEARTRSVARWPGSRASHWAGTSSMNMEWEEQHTHTH